MDSKDDLKEKVLDLHLELNNLRVDFYKALNAYTFWMIGFVCVIVMLLSLFKIMDHTK